MEHEPTVKVTRRLRDALSSARWTERVEEAVARRELLDAVREVHPDGQIGRAELREVDSTEHWSNLRRWDDWDQERAGEPWERMLDRRLPPRPWKTPQPWELTVRALGRQEPQPRYDQMREVLVAEFGPEAKLSDATLGRILEEAELPRPVGRRAGPVETVEHLPGGGGLVLLTAAMAESGAVHKIAEGVIALAKEQRPPLFSMASEPAGRDASGRLTAEYNHNRRQEASEGVDPLYVSVDVRRERKDLSVLQLASMGVQTLQRRLANVIALPLVTQRRGMVGMNDPAGGWLSVVSGVPYKAATADKTLAELKLLGAAGVMWEQHAAVWHKLSQSWAGEDWRQLAAYVDATQDSWWTDRFAKSAKVSRNRRVMPCLTRTVLSVGPGVPIVGETVSGSADLGEQLLRMLDWTDDVLGEGELGRLTIVDAECGHLEMLRRFSQDEQRDLITVLKGQRIQGKVLEQAGEWEPFRERDELREGKVNLEPKKGAEGFTVRVVEMVRRESRKPVPTWFATTAKAEALPTEQVPEAYLSRWPYQEDLFRRGRNGAGLERSHGFGVSRVLNVAVLTSREKTQAALRRATEEATAAEEDKARADRQLAEAKQRLKSRRQEADKPLNGRHALGVRQGKRRVAERKKATRQANKSKEKARKAYETQRSMPDEIYVRDTALDSVTTCLKMALLSMLEFIVQEYLGGWRLMPRTLANAWVPLPVTIRTSRHRVVYEVAGNPRDPKMTELLGTALQRITERKLRVEKRLLVARLRPG